MLDVFKLSLRHQRGALIGWGIGLFAIAWMTAGFYHFIGAQYEDVWSSFPPEFRDAFGLGDTDLGTPQGFLTAEYLSYIPILYAVYAIGWGARALAGEEQEGTLDILLAAPVSRIRVALEKILALFTGILLLSLAGSLGLALGFLTGGVDLPIGYAFLSGLDMVPISLFFAAMAFLGSAAFHVRGRASLVATAYTVGAFFINLFAPLADTTQDLKYGSVFHYFQQSKALSGDLDPTYWALCLGLSLVLFLVAVALFDRKDLTG